jgi:peptidoglycan/xylan/chitin deacetylase (PgdA/CDA1 family)
MRKGTDLAELNTMPRTLCVLGYHKIGAPPANGWHTWFYIPEEVFAKQLSFLRDNAWEAISGDTFIKGLAQPASLPPKSVLLTFDDGYRSLLRTTLPWLRKFNFPAVVFVPTAYIGGHNEFDAGNEPSEPICGWDDLHELERQGLSVQSHGVAHRRLSQLDAKEQRLEIFYSKLILESRLDKPVSLFSFAYGDDCRAADGVDRMLREAGYHASFLYGGGQLQLPLTNHFAIPRLAMGPETSLADELRDSQPW